VLRETLKSDYSLALVKPGEGSYLEVGDELHRPIDQALGIIKESTKQGRGRKL